LPYLKTAAGRLSPGELSREMTLDQLPLGESASVSSVEASSAMAQRLEDLGFVPGTRVTARRRAPLGNPRVYELRGSQLCLRDSEARAVRVSRG
jgi:ferrous iron transport protein A